MVPASPERYTSNLYIYYKLKQEARSDNSSNRTTHFFNAAAIVRFLDRNRTYDRDQVTDDLKHSLLDKDNDPFEVAPASNQPPRLRYHYTENQYQQSPLCQQG